MIEATDLALSAVVTLAFVIEATAGFGATVVTVTLASHFLPIEQVLAALLPVNLLLSALLSWRNRGAIDVAILRRHVLPWMLPAMGVGMVLFALRAQIWIKAVFALFVVLLAAIELGRLLGQAAPPRALSPARRIAALCGAGLIHGLFACGGPLLVYVIGRELPDKGRFRATLSSIWLGLGAILLLRYAAVGTLSGHSALRSMLLLPPLWIGLVLGERIHHRLNPTRFRIAVFSLMFGAGASLLWRTLGAGG